MDCIVHGILQARILECVALSLLPNPGIEPRSPALQVDSLPAEPQGKPPPLFLSILWLLTIDLALHLLSLCPYKSCQSTLICFCLSSSYPWNLAYISTHVFSQQHLGLIVISFPSPDNYKTSPCFHCFLGHVLYHPPKYILWIIISAFLELSFLSYYAMSSYVF